MSYLLLSLIVGVSAAIFVWTVFLIERDLNPSVLRRLDRIKRKSNESGESVDKEGLNINEIYLEYKIYAVGQFLKDYKFTQQIKEMIKLADSNLQIDTFLFLSLLCAAPCCIFVLTPFKLMAAFSLLTFFIPTFYLQYLINKRFLEFSKQFPDALNLMASSLRAGHPLFYAIDIVTSEMPKPISDVFATAQKDISLGVDTKEAFSSMTKAVPKSIDLRFFITAVLIQKEVGGNLAELLDSLSSTIRERFKLMGQLRVQTAQTRLSGMVIAVVPLLVLLVVFFMNPDYIKPLFTTNDRKIAFYSAIGLSILGFLSIKKISDIEF